MAVSGVYTDSVRWHDLECGRYSGDLAVWRRLAARCDGPLLDLGCGTGRTTLALARAGHAVTAVDVDAELLAAVAERARGLDVSTVHADITDLGALGSETWPLVILPMQTIQLLEDEAARHAMFSAVRSHLQSGGLFAAAIVTSFETFDERSGTPEPDMARYDGALFVSRPLAVRVDGDSIEIERDRWIGRPGEAVASCGRDVVRLQRVSAAELALEAERARLAPVEVISVPETGEHVANEVVVFRAR
jgi:SAM-dependent methyltransferase